LTFVATVAFRGPVGQREFRTAIGRTAITAILDGASDYLLTSRSTIISSAFPASRCVRNWMFLPPFNGLQALDHKMS